MGAYRTLTLIMVIAWAISLGRQEWAQMRPPLEFYPEQRATNPHPAHYHDQVAAYERWREVRLNLETRAGWYDPQFMKKWRRRHLLVKLKLVGSDLVYKEWIA